LNSGRQHQHYGELGVSDFGAARVEEDLRHYLQERQEVIPIEINNVVSDMTRFVSASASRGLEMALAELPIDEKSLDRPFIETCYALVDHHVRFVTGEERTLAWKSLYETYVYFAGPEHILEATGKTKLVRSLKSRGAKSFAGLFLSLYLFNVISTQIRDDVSARIPNARSFNLYMLGIEARCRDIVRRALKTQGNELDDSWAEAVRQNIESELLGNR
jgi:hypothetical protein